MEAIKNRYEFTVLFDVENGNPNGDPDADNMPRVDIETGYGIVTDVCLKRKIRNFVELSKAGQPRYNILVKPDEALNSKFTRAYEEKGLEKGQKGKKQGSVKMARDYMCENYFDVRAFGAVMSTGDDPCGIVRGPIQFTFARSLDRIFSQDITITRQSRTTEKRTETGDTEIGRKHIVPYALYRVDGYISAALAQNVTGLNEDDIELLWTAIINMFEHDRSAARGKMCVRKLIVFKHDSLLGNCPAQILLEKINAEKNANVVYPRSFKDYTISIDENVPEGVTLITMI